MAEHTFERFRRLRGLTLQAPAPAPGMIKVLPRTDGVLGDAAPPARAFPSAEVRMGTAPPLPAEPATPADPRLMQLQYCPNPACMDVIIQASQFVHERLAGQLGADYTPLFTSPAYRTNREHLIVALQAGDLEATKAVCRAWCKLVIGWTHEQRAEAYARQIDGVRG